jgi:hypothetical protein
VLAHWNNSPQVNLSPHSDILSWFRANQSLLFLLNVACLAEKQQIPFLLSLVWLDRGLNPRSTALEASTLTITSLMYVVPRERIYFIAYNNIYMLIHSLVQNWIFISHCYIMQNTAAFPFNVLNNLINKNSIWLQPIFIFVHKFHPRRFGLDKFHCILLKCQMRNNIL